MEYTGDMLRAARNSAGLSLRQLATRLGTGASYLGKAETGKIPITARLVRCYEKELGAEAMERRTLLAGVLAGAASPMVIAAQPAAASESLSGLTTSQWVDRIERLELDYWDLGADEMRRRLMGYLPLIHEHRDSPEAWAATARLLCLHAYSLPRTDGIDGGVYWYRLGVGAADSSYFLDRRVEARGRAALALAQGDGSQMTYAAALANQAIELAGNTPSFGLMCAELAISHAHTYAGNIPAARIALDSAKRTFDGTPTSGIDSDYSMTEYRWNLSESRLRSNWGDKRALSCQDYVRKTAPAGGRVMTQIEMHQGLLMAKQGDKAAGLAHAQRALKAFPVEKRSVTLGLVLAEVKSA